VEKTLPFYNRKYDIKINPTDFGITVKVWMGDFFYDTTKDFKRGPKFLWSIKRLFFKSGRRIHEMEVELDVSFPDMVIRDLRGKMIKVPRDECRNALSALNRAVGLEIKKGLTVKMEGRIGGNIGCAHLTNLVMQACHSSVQGQYAKFIEGFSDVLDEMSPVERTKAFLTLRPQMIDSCAAYKKDSEFISEALKHPETERIRMLFDRLGSFLKTQKDT
jgi:hypothetical protein